MKAQLFTLLIAGALTFGGCSRDNTAPTGGATEDTSAISGGSTTSDMTMREGMTATNPSEPAAMDAGVTQSDTGIAGQKSATGLPTVDTSADPSAASSTSPSTDAAGDSLGTAETAPAPTGNTM